MRKVFADSYYYLAFVNDREPRHTTAIEFSKNYHGTTLTTEWVLTGVGDALSTYRQRHIFVNLITELRNQPGLLIVDASHDFFDRGVELYSKRLDKNWSLTDCISFVIMDEMGITDALTAAHHFEQAGFVALLK